LTAADFGIFKLNLADRPRSERARTATTERARRQVFGTSPDREREQPSDTAEPPSTRPQETTTAADSTTIAAGTETTAAADSTAIAAGTETTAAAADSTALAAGTETTAAADSTTIAAETVAGRWAEKAAGVATGRGKTRQTHRDEDPLSRFRTVGTAVASKKSTPPLYLLMFDENGVAHSNGV